MDSLSDFNRPDANPPHEMIRTFSPTGIRHLLIHGIAI